jgi:hypothetical protein
MGQKDSGNIFVQAGELLALFVFGPFFVLAILAGIFQLISPALPFVAVALLIGVGVYGVHRYKTSPFTIRREHEREVLELLARAEQQQRALPSSIQREQIALALVRAAPAISDTLVELSSSVAEDIYREEFLRALPPMPGVPLEGERIYDDNVDRRTLKKGEEPPYRIRTDAKGRPTSLELEFFKEFLHRFIASTLEPPKTVALFAEVFGRFVAATCPPLLAGDAKVGICSVPMLDLMPDPKAAIAHALGVLWDKRIRERIHFSSIRSAFERNRRRISAMQLREREIANGQLVNPDQFSGTAREALDAYLADTPLRAIFLEQVPFALPPAKRFEGHWIVARQGSGKTNALECLIHADLEEVIAGRASVLVMDSQGTAPDTLLGRLSSLKLFDRGQPLENRLIYLEPDLEFPLALNIFDIGLADMELTPDQRENIVSSACEVVEFLFTGLLGGELSDNMTMLYRYLVPAMLAIPGADMNTFIELLDTDTGRDRTPPPVFQKYQAHLAKLEPEIRSFLESDFLRDPELVKTKAAVRRRLRAAMADATFRRMFMQPRNKLNLFRELQSAKVILVNTYPARNYVEQFGRLILALLMQATRQRLEIDRGARMPTYVYIDECQDYIAKEERIARYIDKCRKQNVGLIFANQRLSNIENARVLNALSNVAIKFAGVSDADTSELAAMVGSTPDHIRSLQRGTFAAHVSGVTPRAIDLTFPLSPFEHLPRWTRPEWEQMRSQMRSKYAVKYESRASPAEAGAVASTPTRERTSSGDMVDRPRTAESSTVIKPANDDYDPLA